MNGHDPGLPVEQFIQALTSQLDRAQATLAMKARAGLPLTFAVKDLTLDLRTHLEVVGSVIRIRPAGPDDREASTIRLQLTTITRPMIEENAVPLGAPSDEPSLREVLGPDVTEDEERRLEWAGIHNVSQLREIERRDGEEAIQKFTQLPINRLRAALNRASMPRIVDIRPEPLPPAKGNGEYFSGRLSEKLGPSNFGPHAVTRNQKPDLAPATQIEAPSPEAPIALQPSLLKIRGSNLLRGFTPKVSIGGVAVPVVHAAENELIVAPTAPVLSGTLAVEVEPGVVTEAQFQFPEPPPGPPFENGGKP